MLSIDVRDICVIGLGYIGLPTAALLSSKGYNVHGVDVNQHAVETINKGRIHIVEAGLAEFVSVAVGQNKLKASTKTNYADVFMICVPTPFKQENGSLHPDLSYITDATKKMAPFVREGNLIILESTSPVGTTKMVKDILNDEGVDTDKVCIAYCPERVLPGQVMRELVENDRIVGGVNDTSTARVAAFYETFVEGEVLKTSAEMAEMSKLTENSFRDVNIAFANELSVICDKEGLDVWELLSLCNRHPRVNILNPGTGVGGHCIAVDPWFIVARNPDDAKIIKTARQVNNSKPKWVCSQIKEKAQDFKARFNREAKIACLGVSFKPDIDDIRESPALEVVSMLKKDGYDILVVEPHLDSMPEFEIVDLESAMKNADIISVLVSHTAFKSIDVQKQLRELNSMDFCGALS